MFAIGDIPEEVVTVRGALEVPEQGMTSEVAFVGDVVIKRCADPRYLDWLRREHDVLCALAGADLPIPRVTGYLDRGDDVWLAITRLPGIPFDAAMAAADVHGRAVLACELGALLRRIHATAIPPALRGDGAWIEHMLAQAERNLTWCDGKPDLLAELRAQLPPPIPETLIHGDLGLDNVLVVGDRISAIVDWPMGGSGDPRVDIAIALEARDEFGTVETAAFHVGYGSSPLATDTQRWFWRLWDFF